LSVLVWLALALALMISLSALRLNVGYCILAGLLLFGALVLGPGELARCLCSSLLDLDLWDAVASVALIAILGSLMRELGQVDDIASGLRSLGLKGRNFIAVGSTTFGLLPLPGGAILSASLVEEEGRSEGMDARGPATANLLFRHFNFFAYPLSPVLIVLASPKVLNVDLYVLIAALAPAAVAHLIASYVASFFRLKQEGSARTPHARNTARDPREGLARLGRGLAPVLVAPVLNAVGLGLTLSVCGSIAASILLAHGQAREAPRKMWVALKKSRAHNLAFPVLFAMLFRDVFKASEASEALREGLSFVPLPETLALMLLCFSLGIATGSGMLSIAVLPSGMRLSEVLPVYTGAVVGYIISPLHLCFIVSAEYFGLRQAEMYPRLLAYAALTLGMALASAWVLLPFL